MICYVLLINNCKKGHVLIIYTLKRPYGIRMIEFNSENYKNMSLTLGFEIIVHYSSSPSVVDYNGLLF